LTDAAAALGVKTDFTGPVAYTPNEELNAFQKAVAQKPSRIMLSATKPELFTTAINGAIAQGIPGFALMRMCLGRAAYSSSARTIFAPGWKAEGAWEKSCTVRGASS
jgi:ABC-type sugar transport system substrate-binding protein